MKLVSIIIPCFNAGKYLRDAVESVQAQTYPHTEVVIVDDGSTDPETIQLLALEEWPRTRIIKQKNAGPAAARNRAIGTASGEYILPLDADDTIEPTYIEKAVGVIEQNPDVGCVYCKAMKFGAETGPWELPPYRLEELVIDNVIFVSGLFRKSDWEKVGGFTESLRHGVEDYDFWVKLVASGREIVQLDEYLFNYRVQSSSRTSDFVGTHENVVTTYADIFRANKDFYARHAEIIFRHRFALYRQINESRREAQKCRVQLDALENGLREIKNENDYWRARYGTLEALFERRPWLTNIIRYVRRIISHVRRGRNGLK